MRFKKNYTLKITMISFVGFLLIVPISAIVVIIENKDLFFEKGYIIPILFGLGAIGIIVLMSLINLIVSRFIRHTIFINEGFVEYNGKKVNFDIVGDIRFHIGSIERHGIGDEPCGLVLYNKKNYPILTIDNPSFISCLVIMSRCKDSKNTFIPKWAKILFLSLYLITALIIFILWL